MMTHTEDEDEYDFKTRTLSERHFLLGEYHKAEDILTKSISRRKSSWLQDYFLLSRIYWQVCNFNKLKPTIRELLNIDSENYSVLSQAYAFLGASCVFTGEKEKVSDYLKQSEYYAYRIKNDFDLIDSLRTLGKVLLIIKNPLKAEKIARQGITIGLRHSSCFPTFDLLVLLIELYINGGHTQEALYFLHEADFYLELNHLLPSKELILYYYYKYKLEPGLTDTEKKDLYLVHSFQLLEKEKKQIRDPELVKNFLALRSFTRIETEMERLAL